MNASVFSKQRPPRFARWRILRLRAMSAASEGAALSVGLDVMYPLERHGTTFVSRGAVLEVGRTHAGVAVTPVAVPDIDEDEVMEVEGRRFAVARVAFAHLLDWDPVEARNIGPVIELDRELQANVVAMLAGYNRQMQVLGAQLDSEDQTGPLAYTATGMEAGARLPFGSTFSSGAAAAASAPRGPPASGDPMTDMMSLLQDIRTDQQSMRTEQRAMAGRLVSLETGRPGNAMGPSRVLPAGGPTGLAPGGVPNAGARAAYTAQRPGTDAMLAAANLLGGTGLWAGGAPSAGPASAAPMRPSSPGAAAASSPMVFSMTPGRGAPCPMMGPLGLDPMGAARADDASASSGSEDNEPAELMGPRLISEHLLSQQRKKVATAPSGLDATTAVQYEMLKALKHMQKGSKGSDNSSDSESLGDGGGGGGLKGIVRLRRRIRRRPMKIILAYRRKSMAKKNVRVCADGRLTAAFAHTDTSFRIKGVFGKMTGLWRVHYAVSMILGAIEDQDTLQAGAICVQLLKCLHQTARDGGGWHNSQLLLPWEDPLTTDRFGGDESEMLAIASWNRSIKDLTTKVQGSGWQGDEEETEEGSTIGAARAGRANRRVAGKAKAAAAAAAAAK